MPTGVKCVQYSIELTPHTAFTAVCVCDLLVSETGAVYKSGAYSLQSMGEWGVLFVWV